MSATFDGGSFTFGSLGLKLKGRKGATRIKQEIDIEGGTVGSRSWSARHVSNHQQVGCQRERYEEPPRVIGMEVERDRRDAHGDSLSPESSNGAEASHRGPERRRRTRNMAMRLFYQTHGSRLQLGALRRSRTLCANASSASASPAARERRTRPGARERMSS